MKVKSESEVAQLCPTLSDPVELQPTRLLIHGIFQARVLEWGAIAFSAPRTLGFLKSGDRVFRGCISIPIASNHIL